MRWPGSTTITRQLISSSFSRLIGAYRSTDTREATGNTVLADTLDEFLALLALGSKLHELGKGWPDVPESGEETQRYRAWLHDRAGLEVPQDGHAIVARARSTHPDLDAFVDQWAESAGARDD